MEFENMEEVVETHFEYIKSINKGIASLTWATWLLLAVIAYTVYHFWNF